MPDEPDFDQFGHDEAWQVGSALVAACRAEQDPPFLGGGDHGVTLG